MDKIKAEEAHNQIKSLLFHLIITDSGINDAINAIIKV